MVTVNVVKALVKRTYPGTYGSRRENLPFLDHLASPHS